MILKNYKHNERLTPLAFIVMIAYREENIGYENIDYIYKKS